MSLFTRAISKLGRAGLRLLRWVGRCSESAACRSGEIGGTAFNRRESVLAFGGRRIQKGAA